MREQHEASSDHTHLSFCSVPLQAEEQRQAELVAYWQQQLLGAPALLELPTDYPRPAVQTFNRASMQASIPEHLIEQLTVIYQQTLATPSMVLLAAFDVILARLSGQNDFVVGIPIKHRDKSQTNTMVRADVSGNPSFRETVERTRVALLAAYAHQGVSFDRLREALQHERNSSYSPISQVHFTMIDMLAIEHDRGDATAAMPPDGGANPDLTMCLTDNANDLILVYNPDLFSQERMKALLDQYLFVLAQVVDRPDIPFHEIGLVSPSARRVLPDPTTPLSGAWEGAVHQLFSHLATTHPEQLAIIDSDGTTWTYAELNARSNQLARHLCAAGIAPGMVIAIWAERSAALVWAILGIFKAGATYTILDPAYPPARLMTYLEQAQAHGLIILSAAKPMPPAIRSYCDDADRMVVIALPNDRAAIEASPIARQPSDDPTIPVGPDDIACIAFTSGSTGVPKGVLQRHGPLTHFLPWQQATFDIARDDRYSLLSGLAHDPLQRDIFTPLCLGATICIPDPVSLTTPGHLALWMCRSGITCTNLTPAMMQVLTQPLVNEPSSHLPDLRYAFIVGEVLKRHDVERLWEIAPRVICVNIYGSTETQRALSFHPIPRGQPDLSHGEKEVIPLGQGMRDVQVLILSSDHELCGIGEIGEISMRSPHLALGYLHDPALTEQRFLINPFTGRADDRLYRTGDLGRYLPDGSVVFATRADQQIKVRGFRVELGEIEAVLRTQDSVRSAAVIIQRNATDDAMIVAYVVPSTPTDSATLPDTLRELLRAALPSYMIPAYIVPLAMMPLTPNGKLDRQALPLPDADDSAPVVVTPPSTPMEKTVAPLWQEILGVRHVDIHTNFFDSGGHSLLAMQLLARIYEATGCEISLRHLFEAPTIATLAAYITANQTQRTQQRPGIIALPRVFSRSDR